MRHTPRIIAFALACLGAAYGQTGRKTVLVSTPDQLLRAVAPNTEIVLKPGEYDLDKARSKLGGLAVWTKAGEGRALVLRGLRNFVMRGEDGEAASSIVTGNPEAVVISFENCVDSVVRSLNLAHRTMSPCGAPVIRAYACSGLDFEDCLLEGCGSLGLEIENCDNVRSKKVTVSGCGLGGASVFGSEFIGFTDCRFSGNAAHPLLLSGETVGLVFTRTVFEENEGSSILGRRGEPLRPIEFKECSFIGNDAENWSDGFLPIKISGCSFKGNGFAEPPAEARDGASGLSR